MTFDHFSCYDASVEMKNSNTLPRNNFHGHALKIFGALFVIFGIALPLTSHAATAKKPSTPAYRAEILQRSTDALFVEPKAAVDFWIEVKNTGTKTWLANGSNLVALNPVRLQGKELVPNTTTKLRDKSWNAFNRPVKLTKNVKPGETVRLSFKLRAPTKAGEYREQFSLAIKGIDWMPGGAFELLLRADNPSTALYRMSGGVSTDTTFTMPKGKAKTFSFTVTNTGTQTWKRTGTGAVVLAVVDPSKPSAFYHANWISKTVIGRLTTNEVKPGKKGTFRFALQAPDAYGEFSQAAQIVVPNLTRVVNGEVTLTVVVPAPVVEGAGAVLTAEPTVRVGVVTTSDGWVEVSSDRVAVITDANGAQVAELAANSIARLTYAKTGYSVTANGVTIVAPGPLRVYGKTEAAILTVTSWNSQYNKFRNILELRSTPATGKVWLINELPMEQYVSGLAETGNTGPTEFMKSLVVAARTYALFHNLRKTKHADEFYDINATTDQVYRGYGYELKVPNLVAAVVATRGVVATHTAAVSPKNTVGAIVAAYSSCTDGRTRSIPEVWGYDQIYFPYLLTVPDAIGTCTTPPYPATYIKGSDGNHMVGMSAFGALKYAKDQSKTYDWILKNYYTGVDLRKVY